MANISNTQILDENAVSEHHFPRAQILAEENSDFSKISGERWSKYEL